MILRVKGLEEWGEIEVNCLLKELAMSLEAVWVLFGKEIGWLGGMEFFLPERDLRTDQNLVGLDLWLAEERVSCHF